MLQHPTCTTGSHFKRYHSGSLVSACKAQAAERRDMHTANIMLIPCTLRNARLFGTM